MLHVRVAILLTTVESKNRNIISIILNICAMFVLHKSSCLQESNLKVERERATDATVKAGSAVAREVNALREELVESKNTIQNLTEQLDKVSYCFYYVYINLPYLKRCILPLADSADTVNNNFPVMDGLHMFTK